MNIIHQFSFPTSISFGFGARKKLSEILRLNGKKRPLLVTDKGILGLPFYKELLLDLNEFTVGTYADFAGNPVESHVTAGARAYRSHDADSLIVLGGGAAIDVAKCVGILVSHSSPLFDFEDEVPGSKVIGPIPFFIALPTTAGTGSEVGRCAVISDDHSKAKKLFCSPHLLPKHVLADPDFTFGLPPFITAATGMDAFTHAVEAFLAKAYHPICDGIALEAISLITSGALQTAVSEPNNRKARSDMLLASLMAAVAFQKGLGLTHSLAHPLSSVCDLHHGLANSLMISHAMRFNFSAVPDKFERLARACSLGSGSEFIAWIDKLRAGIGLPLSLSAAGVKESQIPILTQLAMKDFCLSSNPRMPTEDEIKKLYLEAL